MSIGRDHARRHLLETAATPRKVRGSHELRYVMADPERSIDVGGQLLDAVKRLARWWGVAIHTRALGYGGYRIRLAKRQEDIAA